MKKPEIPDNECLRQKDLSDYGILDTDPEANFDQITSLAAEIFGVQFSVVSFVDTQRQWFKSLYGLNVTETSRDVSFCGHAILSDDILVVADALKDDRFFDNPLVLGPPHIRFYAGAPLISPAGYRLGTLCVFDSAPKVITESQKNILLSLSRHVIDILELRKKTDQLGSYAKIFQQSADPVMTLSPPEWKFTSANPATLNLFKVESEEKFLSLGPSDISPEYQPDGELSKTKAQRMITTAMEKGSAFFEWNHNQLDGKIMACTVLLSRIDQVGGRYLQATVRDISQQKFLESQFIEAQSISKIGSWSYSLETQQQFWSEEHYKIFEIPSPQPDEVLHRMYRERIHPDDLPALDVCIYRAITFGEDFIYDHRVVLDGGSRIKYVRGRGKVQKDASGKPVYISGTCSDRTEDVESEERHRKLLETMSEGLVILNESGVTSFNSSALKIVQLTADQMTGRVSLPKGWEAIREDGSRFPLREHPAISALKTGKVIPAVQMGVRLPDSSVRWITINSVPVDGRDGRYVISTFSDITLLVRAAEEHRFVLDVIGVGVWKVNLKTNEQVWDRQMYQLYGVDAQNSAIDFNSWREFFSEESKLSVDEGFKKIHMGSDTFSSNLEISLPSGEKKILGCRGQVGRNKEGEPVMIYGINWDRTKETELEKDLELERAKSLHTAKLASIGQLAAGVGHEINNPLAILSGLITMTEHMFLNGGPDVDLSDKFRKMETSVVRISNIVRGLRTFARSDRAEVTEFDPFIMVNETVDFLKEIYGREGVVITIEQKKRPLTISANRGRLEQVLVNLLSNAKDASCGKSERKINVSVHAETDEFEIVVEDNGSGIRPEIREKIFEPFFTTKDVNLGTGIGLSLVNTIVKEHEGKIELKSEVGTGTEFRIKLPLKSKNIQAVNEPINKPSMDRLNCRILIVDDESELREVLREILSFHCTEVITADTAEEGLKVLRQGGIDLVLSDIKMPMMDGFEFLKLIRREQPISRVKFLFVTGGVEMSTEEQKIVDRDSDGVFYKPIKIPDLLERIKQTVNS
jgi:PAS domain S-box-containing protein